MKKIMMIFAVAMCAMVARATETIDDWITIKDKYFSGSRSDSICKVTGGNVDFENCTFENVSGAKYGSCVYIDRGSGTGKVTFKNCKFINCGNTTCYGGAIYVESIGNTSQEIIFENCVAIGCKAKQGGFLYINDNETVVRGSGNTIIAGCSAEYGGGVYANRLDTFDGFILVDNKATYYGGGMYDVNYYGKGEVINCRFYRNVASYSDSYGGGLYVDDGSGAVKNCRFFENTANTGADYYIDDSSTTRENNLSSSDYANRSFTGEGTEESPFQIKNIDDWDALCYKVKNGTNYEGKHFVLLNDLVVCNSVGEWVEGGFNKSRTFNGTFDGNGRTITLWQLSGAMYNSSFRYTDGAYIKNLRVRGRIVGGSSTGGIIGYAKDSRVENCINYAEVQSDGENTGGIVGLSYMTTINACVNNGNVNGKGCVGGVVGKMMGESTIINVLNNGAVSSTRQVGGIVGYEDSYYTLKNCHSFGSVTTISQQYKAGGITGYSHFGSEYELCFYNKDGCPAADPGAEHGTGYSHEALWGTGNETIKLPEAMEEINAYIKTHNKAKDGWLRVALNREGQPVFAANGLTDEIGWKVQDISDSEYIFCKLGKLYSVKDNKVSDFDYTIITSGTSSIGDGNWYVVDGKVSRGMIKVNGTANLVFFSNSLLEVQGRNASWYEPGISVTEGNTLNIFGIESGMLKATGGDYGAGIGGGDGQSCGTVNIYGGTVIANGGDDGAGIGGGYGGRGGNVTINGGTVEAHAGWANGAENIGKGFQGGKSGTLTLGTRVFKLDDSYWKEGVIVTFDIPENLWLAAAQVDGGKVKNTINGKTYIFALEEGCSLTLTFDANDYTCSQEFTKTVKFGPIVEDTTIDATKLPKAKSNEQVAVEYVLADGTGKSEKAYPLYSMNCAMTMSDGWYVVNGEVTTADITVQGNVNLILADGAKLTVNGGIWVDKGNTLTIYGQQGGSGELVANGADYCAGIGGRNPNRLAGYGNCGTIIINGGKVTATGGSHGAGIGGGHVGDGGTVTVNGGSVTATGGAWAAGIGGGEENGKGGDVTINGGTVTANGGSFAAGIGGGNKGNGGYVMINGGTVTATGQGGGKGIGSGNKGTGGTLTLDERVEIVEGKIGGNYIKIVEKKPIDPTCEGGEIAEGEDGVWVITPNEGVEAVTIGNLPEEAKVAVKLNGYNVPSSAFMGWGEGGIFSLALNPEVVQPKVGELGEGEPFVVGEGEVALTIKTIAGLKYSLIRGAEIGAIDEAVVTTLADGAEMTLKDDDPPTGKAFYKVGVGK